MLDNVDFTKYEMSSMKVWLTAGSPMSPDVKKKVMEIFPGQLMELWGTTEGLVTTIRAEDIVRKDNSVGQPLPCNDIRIIDNDGNELPRGECGEIVGYCPYLMTEYYKLPEKTAKEIWVDERGITLLKTGDIGKIDEEGFLYILDRKKDDILSGGINIFASDIEDIMIEHPEIKDVAVIAMPHDKWGEAPLAFVIKMDGSKLSEQDIIDWTNPQLAKYQRIVKVQLINEFPRNAMGKVLKKDLREPLWKDRQ